MRKLIPFALLAAAAMPAVAMPTTAMAQSHHGWHDQNRDRHDRYERHDRDRHWGNDDWRNWRAHNRSLYARGRWHAPFRYHRFRPGVRIARGYYGSRYVIADPWRYHLPAPGRYRAWVRHYDDVLLIDTRRGVVLRVIPGFYF